MISKKILSTIIMAAEAKTQNVKVSTLLLHDPDTIEQLKAYLVEALDPQHNFYMTLKNLPKPLRGQRPDADFAEVMNGLRALSSRRITGNAADMFVAGLLGCCNPESRQLFKYAIDRKLPGNIGETIVNRAFPGLIYHQPYGGVASYDPEKIHTRFNWKNDAGQVLEEKADGFALFLEKSPGGICSAHTRQGQDVTKSMFYIVAPVFDAMEPGTVHHYEACLNDENGKKIPRVAANGLFNSHFKSGGLAAVVNGKCVWATFKPQQVELTLLDIIDYEGFYSGIDHTPCEMRLIEMGSFAIKYEQTMFEMERLTKLGWKTPRQWPTVRLPICMRVHSVEAARKIAGGWIGHGMEGAVLKDPQAPWKDTRMTSQMKLKNEFECTLEVVKVLPHKRHPEWVGSFVCLSLSSNGLRIETKVGSGLNEDPESELCRTDGHERWMNKIIEVKAECISKHNALQHPRITMVRHDKTVPDTYDQVKAAYLDSIATDIP